MVTTVSSMKMSQMPRVRRKKEAAFVPYYMP